MGKGKKGKHAADDESNDASPVRSKKHSISSDNDEEKKVLKKEKQKKPQRERKRTENSEDDSDLDLKTAKDNKKTYSDDEVPEITSKKPTGFALLAMDDDDNDNEEDSRDESLERSQSPEVIIKKPQKETGKKSKKSKKKKDEDDEDIDKVLAELEMEYSGQKPVEVVKEEIPVETGKKSKKKNKKKDEDSDDKAAADAIYALNSEEAEPTLEDAVPQIQQPENGVEIKEEEKVKSASQKKREKKKEKKQQEKREETPVEEGEKEEEDGDKTKKKKKGGKEEKDKGKGPGKKTLAAMQEALKKLREEEERMKQEEEERLKREEEAEQARLEALRIEKEKKERKKQKEKERKERLKAEGKLLTAKQKLDKARAQELINALKAKGLELPEPGEKKPRPGTRVKPYKKQNAVVSATENVEVKEEQKLPVEVEVAEKKEVIEKEEEDEVKDTWDADSDEEKVDKNGDIIEEVKEENKVDSLADEELDDSEESLKEEEDEEESEEESEDEDESENENGEEEKKTDAEKKREKALARIQKRKEDAEVKRTLSYLRAAVVCVLGHVDTGKTKILDKLRRTNVQVGEAGGITQQIGATNVPMENIKDTCKLVKGFNEMKLKLPGLLIIDTPGHESFSNLRSRGSSLCDIAILVVDIMHGLEQQTIESICLLKSRKTPFVVALNKIDRLYDWQTGGRKDVRDIIKSQAENTQREFEQRSKEVIVQFAEQGLNASLYYENPDPRNYVSLVPTSAITGEGMGNLLALIVEFCQSLLAKRLMYSEQLQATVLEVKAISGLGTTIDCILVNGRLREGDTIVLAGTDGPVVTQIRSLLMPQPMKELRVKNAYIEYKEVKAAQGVKIAGKDLEKAIAGLNLQVAEKPDEIEIFCEEVARELKTALSGIKLKERGVYVQASTLGSLEALLEFLRTSNIPYSGIRIGPVVKKDVMKASIMLEHEPQYATILAFDVKIERDAQELADSLGVKIFQADIIYHLFDKFMEYREELKRKKREEFKNIAVFPCKIRILPQYVFNSRDPIVVGVMIEAGIVKEGTPLCVPAKEGKEEVNLGIVTSVEQNHKPLESARKGMEVCLKIENVPGETPKLFGRHFDHTDIITSKISRQSIDACKDYFRDDLTKADWQLMVELKKLFQIM